MEKPHRIHKREHSVRDDDLEHHSKHRRQENAYHGRARDRLVESTVKPQALIDRDHRELSGDKDYVRMWLAQMKDEGQCEWRTDPSVKTGLDRTDEPDNEQHVFLLSAHKIKEQLRDSHTRSKSKRNPSPDSSLLHVPLKPTTEHESVDMHDMERVVLMNETPTTSKRHKDKTYQGVHSSISGPSQVQAGSKAFGKRARHKTREDKYELKKQPKKTSPEEKPTKKRREKKGDQRRAARKASEGLRDNFNSSKIGQERLTVRPTTGLGIFKNGRASSPTRRRGLPDLAFSEMDFLRRSGKYSSTHDTTSLSKSRLKENRKALREQDEIATFFMPPKTPVREVLSTSGAPSSPTSMHAASIYERKMEMNGDLHHPYPQNTVPRSACSEERHLDPRSNSTRQVFCSLPWESNLDTQYKQNAYETACDVGRSNSEQAPTAVSWSESHNSPDTVIASRREEEKRRQLQSSTPSSVRDSLERSGVFKNTGIHSKTNRQGKQLCQETGSELTRNKTENIIPKIASKPKNTAPTSKYGQCNPSMAMHIDQEHSSSIPLRMDRTPLPDSLSPRLSENNTMQQPQPDTLPQRLEETLINNSRGRVVEYYDTDRGRYREVEDDCIENVTAGGDSIQRPLTRQQLAQNARVRRPSTTVPVIPGASDIVASSNDEDQIERTERDNAETSNQGRTAVLESQILKAAPQTRMQEPTSEIHFAESNRSMPDKCPSVEQEHHVEEVPVAEMYSTKPTNVATKADTRFESTNTDSFEPHHPLQRDEAAHSTPHIQRSPLTRFPSLYVRQLEHEEQRQHSDNIFQTLFNIDQEDRAAIGRNFEQEMATNETIYQELLANAVGIGGIAPDYADDLAFVQRGEYHIPELWPDDLDHMNGQQSQSFQPDPYNQWTEEQLWFCPSWDDSMQDPQRDLEYTTDHQVNPTGDFACAEQSPDLEQRFWRPFQRD